MSKMKMRAGSLKLILKEAIGKEMLELSDETTMLAQKLAKQLALDLKQGTKEDPIKLDQRVSKTIFGMLQTLAKQYGTVGGGSEEEEPTTKQPAGAHIVSNTPPASGEQSSKKPKQRGSWFRS
jgi:hypothetical protein